jgi:hypothetical protein
VNELDLAWDAALEAPQEDQGPWRVLADMLLAEGNPQGELMQLELDLELGPLRGLARGRYPGLKQQVERSLLPVGNVMHEARFRRGALVHLVATALDLLGEPDDQRWRSVQRLVLHYPAALERNMPAPKVPLAGDRLRALQTLGQLTPEALDLLLASPPKPRLRSLTLSGLLPQAKASWARRWPALWTAHPRLTELRFVGARDLQDPQVPQRFEEWLEPLLGAPLERVLLDVALPHLPLLFAWRRQARPAFALVADVGIDHLRVEVRDEELVLSTPDPGLLAEERLRRGRRLAGDVRSAPDTETLIRMNWGPIGSTTPPIRWPPR